MGCGGAQPVAFQGGVHEGLEGRVVEGADTAINKVTDHGFAAIFFNNGYGFRVEIGRSCGGGPHDLPEWIFSVTDHTVRS